MKKFIKKLISFIFDIIYCITWKCSKNRKTNNTLNKEEREDKIIVSLTSFPGRIHIVYKCIRTILDQSDIKADEVVLWLAEEQFPKKENELPQNLINLKKYGLQIRWCEDLRSYKKLIPSLIEYENCVIVTADDDVYYKRNWLKKLYLPYLKDSSNIYCHRITKFVKKDGQYDAIGGGDYYYKDPSYLNKLVGVGGVLYPPNSLDDEVLKSEIFMKLAPTNDDIWFWFMAIKNETKISAIPNNDPKPIDVFGSQATEKLTDINDRNEFLFWKQFNELLMHYPDIEEKLERE